jgi:hypothetical protein
MAPAVLGMAAPMFGATGGDARANAPRYDPTGRKWLGR